MKGLKKAMVSDIVPSHRHGYLRISQSGLAGVTSFTTATLIPPRSHELTTRTCLGQRAILNRNLNHLSHLLNQDSTPPTLHLVHRPPRPPLPLIVHRVDHH